MFLGRLSGEASVHSEEETTINKSCDSYGVCCCLVLFVWWLVVLYGFEEFRFVVFLLV